MLRKWAVTVVMAMGVLGYGHPSSGAVVYDSAGFEASGNPVRFNPGALDGQDVSAGPWSTDNSVSSATIESAVVSSGVQAVRVNRASSLNGDQRWSVFKPTSPTLRFLSVSWDQNVTHTSLAGVAHGPLFGVEVYDDTGGLTVPLIGSGFIDSTTGDVLYQAQTTGLLTPTGGSITFGRWNHFALQVDFNAGTYQFFLNGFQIASDGFVDPGVTGFSDAPLSTVAYPDALSASATASGSAYFDNYAITTSATVPEPGAFGICAWAIMLFGIGMRTRGFQCR